MGLGMSLNQLSIYGAQYRTKTKRAWNAAPFLIQIYELLLQRSSGFLLSFNAFKKSLEVSSSESAGSHSLNDFEE